MQFLQAVPQDRTILFIQDISANMDPEIRRHTDDKAIEGGMVKLTKGDSVADPGFTFWKSVRDDVGGIQEFLVSKPA